MLVNPKGDVTVVEFFDYRCPYSKNMTEWLRYGESGRQGPTGDEGIDVFGPYSVTAARAALAARNQRNTRNSIAP